MILASSERITKGDWVYLRLLMVYQPMGVITYRVEKAGAFNVNSPDFTLMPGSAGTVPFVSEIGMYQVPTSTYTDIDGGGYTGFGMFSKVLNARGIITNLDIRRQV